MKKGMISILSGVAGSLVGLAVGAGAAAKITGESERKIKGLAEKHLSLFLMMNQWVKVKQEGKNLSVYFDKNNYKKIAVYGMSYAGETLIEELRGTNIEIAYAIDKNANSIYSDINVVTMEDNLEDVDAIVVTAITAFDEIEERLQSKVDCPVISLEDILYEV